MGHISRISAEYLRRHPGCSPDHVDTFYDGWFDVAADALLEGASVRVWDYPSRQWINVQPTWFNADKPLVTQLRRLLADEYGVVAGKQGRRR